MKNKPRRMEIENFSKSFNQVPNKEREDYLACYIRELLTRVLNLEEINEQKALTGYVGKYIIEKDLKDTKLMFDGAEEGKVWFWDKETESQVSIYLSEIPEVIEYLEQYRNLKRG